MSKPKFPTVTELLSDPKRWTKNACARNSAGNVCDSQSDEAESFCLIGALDHVYQDYGDNCTAHRKLRSVIDQRGALGDSVSLFNDSGTYELIFNAVKDAGI
jgi:hypothetical protein